MADIKRDDPDSLPMYRAPEGSAEIERRLEEDGRDPTARRGEIEEGGSVTDEDVGKDEILRKADGDGPPLTDNAKSKEGE